MRLFVGLGNPGVKYARNRHNIGFMALDAIADYHSLLPWSSKFYSQLTESKISGQRVVLLKPQTFMNDSGKAVRKVFEFYKITPQQIIILHDEIDLQEKTLRIKHGGGHAGHNGLRSISKEIGTEYSRLRLGIGHPGSKEKVVSHVLNDFSPSEEIWVKKLTRNIANHLELLIQGDLDLFQNAIEKDT